MIGDCGSVPPPSPQSMIDNPQSNHAVFRSDSTTRITCFAVCMM
jgi:hypothetical protein